jgi:histidinol-phosphatase (PHP family)
MPVSFEEYGSKVLDAFDILRSHNVGIGVNTSGYRHGIRDHYPIKGFMRAAREAGIETAVIGSDCHTVRDLGRNTLRAAQRLQREGFDHICVFEGRKTRKVRLSEVIG